MHRSAMDYSFFLVSVYPIVTIFSSHGLDTNTDRCVASSAFYTLTP